MLLNECLPERKWARFPGNLRIVIIILVMVMAYPVLLRWLGLPPTVIMSVTATASFLSVRLCRALLVRRRVQVQVLNETDGTE